MATGRGISGMSLAVRLAGLATGAQRRGKRARRSVSQRTSDTTSAESWALALASRLARTHSIPLIGWAADRGSGGPPA